jgi:hypothetical protein
VRLVQFFHVVEQDVDCFVALSVSTLIGKFLKTKVNLILLVDILSEYSAITRITGSI